MMKDYLNDLKSNENSLSVKEYIKYHIENIEFINVLFLNLNAVLPFLIKNGLSINLSNHIESKEEFYNILKNYTENKFEELNLTSIEILSILENHPLVLLKEKPSRIFLVGSFAKGTQHQDSDIDILLEVRKRKCSSDELENKYRKKIQDFFVKNNIREKNENVHPQIRGRRIDIYFTFDADLENRPKIEIF